MAARPRLSKYMESGVAEVRVIVCGGDGTMGWILSSIDSVGAPVGTFPVFNVLIALNILRTLLLTCLLVWRIN